VRITDSSAAFLEKGLAQIDANYARSKRLSAEKKKTLRSRITGVPSFKELRDCDLVVEAVFEDMATKQDIFRQVDAVLKPGAFLCSNTSELSIDEIASVTSRPELVMGTHFFSPANVMKLLENVRGAKTSDETIATMMEWGRRIGKWCILVGNCHGFVGNRMIASYNKTAREMLLEGLQPHEVDAAALAFGWKQGPCAMGDLVGLDLGMQAIKKAGAYDPERVLQHALVHAGRCGQKSKAGFYDYDEKRRPVPSPVAQEIIRKVAANVGKKPVQMTEEQIQQRLVFPLINEGFKILAEGMAQRPADIDSCYIHGYSFPRVKGGPMFYADQVGLDHVQAVLEGMGVEPAPLLKECVAQQTTLQRYWKKRAKQASKL